MVRQVSCQCGKAAGKANHGKIEIFKIGFIKFNYIYYNFDITHEPIVSDFQKKHNTNILI